MLLIKDLKFSYQGRLIYNNFNFSIKENEIVTILGPSGCGKTTLVEIIAGYKKPEGGQILVNHKEVSKPSRDRIVINQENDLFEWMTVYQNMKLVVDDDRLIDKYLKLTKLDGDKGLYIKELSGGMRKRLSLARALAVNPKFIIMDEPFASLDHRIKENVHQEVLNIIAENNITVLLVTHDIEEAIFLSSRICILNESRPVEIRGQLKVPFTFPRDILIKDSYQYINFKQRIKDHFK